MFTSISRKIALQFTLVVLCLILVSGTIFLASDVINFQRRLDLRLAFSAQHILGAANVSIDDMISQANPRDRARMRIVDSNFLPVYTGPAFPKILARTSTEALQWKANLNGVVPIAVQGENYRIITLPITEDSRTVGYLQLVDEDQMLLVELPRRLGILLGISLIISLFTYFIGLLFARRSLEPAKQALKRLEQFTQDASHELRTPLAIINSTLDVALQDREYVDGIISAKEDILRANLLIDRLLTLAKMDSTTLHMEMTNVTTLVENVIEESRKLIEEKEINLEMYLETEVMQKGDPALMRQVFSNLMTNAVKFNRKKGTITLKLSHRSFQITDTGSGIPKESIKHIFDSFYQVDPSRSGSGWGLGLAIVQKIVTLHKWRITVDSKEGKGTKFTVTF